MKWLTLIARLLLGFIFVFFGLNGLIHFLPMPPLSGDIALFFQGMMATHYFLPFLAITQIVCGALLMANRFVPLALIVLAPVILNIFLVHVFIDPSGLPLAVVIGLMEAFLAFFAQPYRQTVRGIFKCR